MIGGDVPDEAEVLREGEAGSLVGSLQADEPGGEVTPIGEGKTEELAASDLFDPGTTPRDRAPGADPLYPGAPVVSAVRVRASLSQ